MKGKLMRFGGVALVLSLSVSHVMAKSVVFLHPDGMGANTWSAVRLFAVGPDGRLAWDHLPQTAVYVGPMSDSVNASSNGGATSHAYGVRADLDSYGTVNGEKAPPRAASGKKYSIAVEAMKQGKWLALVNSSSITEPGTGAFLASVKDRDDEVSIAEQITKAKPHCVLGGGEQFFLPKDVSGRHGPGMRNDNRNLIDEARKAGYDVVFTKDELLALPNDGNRVLGLFAAEETFNEVTEDAMRAENIPPFKPQAPRFDEMVRFCLNRMKNAPKGFLLVGNEEGTDNLSGENNLPATIEAARGADRAIAETVRFINQNPETSLIVASDSDNGGMNATSDDIDELPRPLPRRSENGSLLASNRGEPYFSAPNLDGKQLPFYVLWASDSDMAGGTIARGLGPAAAILNGTIDSTDIYRAMYLGLFGRKLAPQKIKSASN